jgi:DNA-binding HxlR family transcriptional regulator
MTKVKEASTNQLNKNRALNVCPVTYTLGKIGGRWKPIIIYNLLGATRRYSELKRLIPAITEKMLIQHLKQLETDGLIFRAARNIVPPYVEYSLTTSGQALKPVIEAMIKWANNDRNRISLVS